MRTCIDRNVLATARSKAMEEPAPTTHDAPRCQKCGYLLLGLTECRCPECGTPFDPEYVKDASFRAHLLPWEQPDAAISRLPRTLLQASIHPGPFFTSFRRRKERRIRHAAGLIAASALTALCFYSIAFLIGRAAFFVRLLANHARPSQALDTVLRAVSITWSSELLILLMQLLSVSLSALVLAAVITRLFRRELGSLRTLDVAAVYSPAIAFGAFVASSFAMVDAVTLGAVPAILDVALLAPMVALLLLLRFSSRRVLLLSRWKAIQILIIGGLIEFLIASFIVSLPWLLFVTTGEAL